MPDRPLPGAEPLPIHCMVAVGGLAALSWELVWQLQATLSLGVSAIGAALTLAATMAGMTLGALAMGAWLERRRGPVQPVKLYGMLEAVIGVSGLSVLGGFAALRGLDPVVYSGAPSLAAPFHLLAVAVLLSPATCAMGATVPVFQLIARTHRTSISALYATNTGGAALGVLLLSFIVLPAIGVSKTCMLLGTLNLGLFGLSRLLRSDPLEVSEPARACATTLPTAFSPVAALFVVTCTGFVTFGLEVAWFRALRSAFWSTSSTFAILLACVLISLAIGARLVPALRRRKIPPTIPLLAAGALVLLSTPLVERMDLAIAVEGPYALVMTVWFGLSLLAIGPAIVCLATALPWCLEDHADPRMTSRLYALNALGSVAGSVIAAWGLLPLTGVSASAWLLGLLPVGVAVGLGPKRLRAAAIAVGSLCLAVAVFTSSSPGRHRIQGRLDFDGHSVLTHREGPDFTTSVIQTPEGARHLLIDGFVATSDRGGGSSYMYWMGSLPALLHPKPEMGLVICFGTGQTANGMRREGVRQIDVVELSAHVFELAPLFEANAGVLGDARVHPIVMDGRAWLRRSERVYDVITLEPMPPNFSGMNALYSREFYEIAKASMSPRGVIAQWLPIHMLSRQHAASIAATFLDVFGDAILWFDPVGGTGVLLGRRKGALQPVGQIWPGFARQSISRPLSPQQIRRAVWLRQRALERYAQSGRIITDDNQLLQYGQLRPAASAERAYRLNDENITILRNFAGRPAFSLRKLRPAQHAIPR